MSQTARVIVAATDPGPRNGLRRMLDRVGCDAVVTHDRESALRQILENPFDVLLLELGRRPLGSRSLLRSLRQRCLQIPFVAIADEPNPRDVVEVFRAGAADCLLTPFQAAELDGAIRRALTGRSEPATTRSDDSLASVSSSGELSAPVARVVARARAGRLRLPAIAPVAADVHDLIGRPDCGVDEVLGVIGTDPAIVAAVLHRANTTVFASARPSADLRSACLRLGNKQTLSIAHELLVASLFVGRRGPLAQVAQAMWRNVRVTSHGTRLMARRLGLDNEEELYVAAMLHNIGELVFLEQVAREEEGLASGRARRLLQPMQEHHEEFGGLALKSWRMPAAVARLGGHHHHRTDRPQLAEDRERCALVVLAWTMAVRAGYAYVQDMATPDPDEALATLGLPAAFAEDVFADAHRWLSAPN